jgi:Sybindin-like family
MLSLLKNVYILYADYVLKDPNYDLDQPIRGSYFQMQIEKLFA